MLLHMSGSGKKNSICAQTHRGRKKMKMRAVYQAFVCIAASCCAPAPRIWLEVWSSSQVPSTYPCPLCPNKPKSKKLTGAVLSGQGRCPCARVRTAHVQWTARALTCHLRQEGQHVQQVALAKKTEVWPILQLSAKGQHAPPESMAQTLTETTPSVCVVMGLLGRGTGTSLAGLSVPSPAPAALDTSLALV